MIGIHHPRVEKGAKVIKNTLLQTCSRKALFQFIRFLLTWRPRPKIIPSCRFSRLNPFPVAFPIKYCRGWWRWRWLFICRTYLLVDSHMTLCRVHLTSPDLTVSYSYLLFTFYFLVFIFYFFFPCRNSSMANDGTETTHLWYRSI